ncbi:MAG: serine acetyltransferase [Chloroflexus sp.]|uniref:serine O-acetyltransferase EpsC n=1 Tax=Chloroflexus sp. TaxID=1904827 RepID=UPI0021DE59DC|nr:serine O-acetyltransferase EpsC [Chloroflexus sp.]GIV90947.1 MAG: serine acetyltransferase [Chloroflexus sp.]
MRISHALCVLRDDIRAIFRNDPAARNLAEVLLYPGLHAIILHRFAHALYRRKIPFIPRLISQISRFLTGIEIHPGARIGRGFFIDHGMGVVIGETAEIGDWVMLYQGVTLGGTGKQTGKRHPTVEDEVVIGVGAIVLGAITIGRGARIGGGAVVVKDVPPHSTAVGVPARIVARRDPITGVSRRVEQLPDPEGEMLRSLHDKVLELEARLIELEAVSRVQYKDFHVKHSELPEQLWQTLLDESAPVEEEYNQGAGI